MPPSSEDFARWRDDPVTRWVFRGIAARVEEQKQHWLGMSWENGVAAPIALTELRARASAWVELIDNDYSQWCGALNVEPDFDER